MSTKTILYFFCAMVGSALADDAPGYRYPATFNDLESTGNNPGHNPAPLLSDEGFFGVWDGTKWTTPGLFDYAAHPGLEPVEAAVKRGDYQAAGEALLAYYRERDAIDLPDLPEADERSKLRTELLMDQVYMHPSLAPLHQFEVRTEPAEYMLDVSGEVRAGNGRFMLTARHKGAGKASFNSREATRHQPELRLVVNGEPQVLKPVADTYLQHGSGPKGNETSLLVSGSRPGVAIDRNTTKALLRFDLSPLRIEAVDKAELVLYGNTDADSGSMSVLLGPDMDSPLEAANEKTLSWADVNHRYFSYQGLDGLEAWRNPQQGRPHTWFFVAAIVRFFHYPDLIAAYLETGDEHYARRAIQIYLDYVEYQMFNRLDDGFRVGNLIRPSTALYKSPSMTPQALMIMLEHSWRLGNWYERQTQWFQDHNYGSSYIDGASGLAFLFPEFRDTPKWWERTHERALYYTSSGMYFGDHSFKEANTWYGTMVMNSLNRYRNNAIDSGFRLPERLVTNFLGIARYAMDVTDPGGTLYPYGDSYNLMHYDQEMIRAIARDHNDPELLFIATDGEEGRRPERTSVWYPDSRLGVMRTAWADENALGLFVNARNGGIHWHPNTLSLCAYGYGRQLIDDTYHASSDPTDPRGVWTSGNTRAHNTVEINGARQRDQGAAGGRMVFNPRFDLFDGFTDATEGFRHQRRVLLVKPSKFWIVSDRLEALAAPESTHRYTQAWHPRPSSRVSIQGEQKVAATAYPSKGNIKIVPADPEELTADLAKGWWVMDQNTYVTYEKSAEGGTTFDTLLYPMPEGRDAEVSVTRLPTGTDTLTATALRLDIRDSTGTRTGWYYLSYEAKPGERTVGPLTTDARMLYFEHDERGRLTLLLEQGTAARHQTHPHPLVEAESPADDLAVEWNAAEKSIRISTGDREATLAARIYAPFTAEHVTVNEKAVGFSQQESLVTINP